MSQKWEHPQLGEFYYNGSAWMNDVEIPPFSVFSYQVRGAKPTATERYELSFDTDSEDDLPSSESIALAETVLTNAAELVTKVCQALWNDFNGTGPRSGMWWHDDLAAVTEDIEEYLEDDAFANDSEEYLLTGPEEILPLMRVIGIAIRYRTGDGPPIAELMFHAAYEPEHGVGILTDGVNILGTGYMVSVRPFRE